MTFEGGFEAGPRVIAKGHARRSGEGQACEDRDLMRRPPSSSAAWGLISPSASLDRIGGLPDTGPLQSPETSRLINMLLRADSRWTICRTSSCTQGCGVTRVRRRDRRALEQGCLLTSSRSRSAAEVNRPVALEDGEVEVIASDMIPSSWACMRRTRTSTRLRRSFDMSYYGIVAAMSEGHENSCDCERRARKHRPARIRCNSNGSTSPELGLIPRGHCHAADEIEEVPGPTHEPRRDLYDALLARR